MPARREDGLVGTSAGAVLDLLADAAAILPAVRECELVEITTAARPGCTSAPICSGSCVSRSWPSCQIQWVSMAVILPGAAAATWVNIASDTSKWLFECEPQVRP